MSITERKLNLIQSIIEMDEKRVGLLEKMITNNDYLIEDLEKFFDYYPKRCWCCYESGNTGLQ